MLGLGSAVFSVLATVAATCAFAAGGGTSYDDRANWPDECRNGTNQSPINFNTTEIMPKSSIELVLFYPDTVSVNVTSDGLGPPQINFDTRGAYLTVNGKRYDFLQLHFHAPSVHTVDGKTTAMEGHLVHQSPDDGALLMIGLLMKIGDPNQALQINFDAMPKDGEESIPAGTIALASLIPDGPMMTYSGSVASPPCTEPVLWFVPNDFSTVSEAQLAAFRNYGELWAIGDGKSRPIQPLNGRVVEEANFMKGSFQGQAQVASSFSAASVLVEWYCLLLILLSLREYVVPYVT